MSKSKSDARIFELANTATTEVLNFLNVVPSRTIRRLVTVSIELAVRQSNLDGFREACADIGKPIKKTGGKTK